MTIDTQAKTVGTLGGLALITVVVGLAGPTCGGRYPGGWTHDGWPLLGKHAPLTCEQCHPQSQGLTEVSVTCASCHEEDRPPEHYEGTDCGLCHTPEGWELASVDHSFFPLTHSHDVSCDACHTNGSYQGLDPACSSCHETDRPAEHFAGTDCAGCHTWTTWGEASVDHSFFPLTHSHDVSCERCHTDGSFKGLDPACSSCHEPDRPAGHYEGTDCVACHDWSSWDEASVDHSFFPLTHSHDVACERCHTGGGYEGLDPACSSCHIADRPAGHYAGECSECHTWTSWDAATWEHTFRVPHEGVSECGECHTAAPDDYGPISCFEGCHEHDRADTDDEHDEVSGYSYTTEACLRCHPTGDE